MKCPRCGTETDSWPCPNCGFPEVMKAEQMKKLDEDMLVHVTGGAPELTGDFNGNFAPGSQQQYNKEREEIFGELPKLWMDPNGEQ